MPSDSESCFLCPEIQGALTTAMMAGPWRVAILRATLDSLTSALEIWGQGSAFSSCTHSYTVLQGQAAKQTQIGKRGRWNSLEAICPGVSCHSLRSTALASLYSLPLGTPFMLKSIQAIFSQDFSQSGKNWLMD